MTAIAYLTARRHPWASSRGRAVEPSGQLSPSKTAHLRLPDHVKSGPNQQLTIPHGRLVTITVSESDHEGVLTRRASAAEKVSTAFANRRLRKGKLAAAS